MFFAKYFGLRRELAAARQDADYWQTIAAARREDIGRLTSDHETIKGELKRAVALLEFERSQAAAYERQARSLRDRLDEASTILDATRARRDDLEGRLEEARRELEEARDSRDHFARLWSRGHRPDPEGRPPVAAEERFESLFAAAQA